MDSWLGPPSMRSWHVLPGSAWVSSGDADFFPHPTDVHTRRVCPVSVQVIRVCVGSPVMEGHPVQGGSSWCPEMPG